MGGIKSSPLQILRPGGSSELAARGAVWVRCGAAQCGVAWWRSRPVMQMGAGKRGAARRGALSGGSMVAAAS